MRKIIELQTKLFGKNIDQIEFDLKSRDEIPKLLMGLQYIYCNRNIREKIFNILEKIIPAESYDTGRPGMDLWNILVLALQRNLKI